MSAPGTMPFGKFKGRTFDRIPDWYLDWLAELPGIRFPLRRAIEREIRKREADAWAEAQARASVAAQLPPCPSIAMAREIVGAGIRSLARRYHPDAGGDHGDMVAANAAAEWLREVLARGGGRVP